MLGDAFALPITISERPPILISFPQSGHGTLPLITPYFCWAASLLIASQFSKHHLFIIYCQKSANSLVDVEKLIYFAELFDKFFES